MKMAAASGRVIQPPLIGTYRLHGVKASGDGMTRQLSRKSGAMVKGRSASRGRLTAAHHRSRGYSGNLPSHSPVRMPEGRQAGGSCLSEVAGELRATIALQRPNCDGSKPGFRL